MELEGTIMCRETLESDVSLESNTELEIEEEEKSDGESICDEEDDDCSLSFADDVNPLDLMECNSSDVQLYERIERLENEAFNQKKRKALSDHHCEGSLMKGRQEAVLGSRYNELLEEMTGPRRKSRKAKKRGRRKGSKKKLSPKVSKLLGEATFQYSHEHYDVAVNILREVVLLEPNLYQPYHTLGAIYNALGDKSKALNCYFLAAHVSRKNSSLWKELLRMSIEQDNTGMARYCLSKAVIADPEDMTLRSLSASLYSELGDYQKAAESFVQISRICPENVEALKMGSKLYLQCGQVELSISILEDYLKDHTAESDLDIVELLAYICMDSNAYHKALCHIEHAQLVYCSGKELPFSLTIKAGICHVHLGNMETAKLIFNFIQRWNACDHANLIVEVADVHMTHQQYESALKYYMMVEGSHDNGYFYLKIARCHLSLNEREKSIPFFYKVIQAFEDNIDVRLTLASILLEEARDDEAISLLSPPSASAESVFCSLESDKPWWLNGEVKLKLSQIYKAKKKLEEFVAVIFCYVRDSLHVESHKRKVRTRKRLPKKILYQRAKLWDDGQTRDTVFTGFRPIAPPADLLMALRAKKTLQKKETIKVEKKAAALAAGIDWQSDDSDEEIPPQESRDPPLPNLMKDEEHYHVVIDVSLSLYNQL